METKKNKWMFNRKQADRETQEDRLQLSVLILRSYVTGLNDGKKNHLHTTKMFKFSLISKL